MFSRRFRFDMFCILVCMFIVFAVAGVRQSLAQSCDPESCPAVKVYGDDDAAICRAWASEAVGLQLENEQRSCGYETEDWHFDIKLHFRICRGLSQLDRDQFAENRRKKLKACREEPSKTPMPKDADLQTKTPAPAESATVEQSQKKTGTRNWDKYCQRSYLVDALKVSRTAEKWACADADPQLHLSKQRHYDFCMAEASKGEGDYPLHDLIRARQDKIQDCKSKKAVKVTLTREVNVRRRACSRFADIFLNATLENKRLKCGNQGDDWHEDWNKHYASCVGLERGARLTKINSRQSDLKTCRAKIFPEDQLSEEASEQSTAGRKGKVSEAIRSACNMYAKSAVAHQAANEQLSCGFSGDLWNMQESQHFDACTAGRADYAFKSNMSRGEKLRQCTSARLCKDPIRATTQFCQDLTGLVPPNANAAD